MLMFDPRRLSATGDGLSLMAEEFFSLPSSTLLEADTRRRLWAGSGSSEDVSVVCDLGLLRAVDIICAVLAAG